MEKNKFFQKNKNIPVIVSVVLSIFSLIDAIYLINYSKSLYVSGSSTLAIFNIYFHIPFFIIVFVINLIELIKYYQKTKDNKQLNITIIVLSISWFISLQCLIAIPLSVYNAQVYTSDIDTARQEKEMAEELQKNTTDAVPATTLATRLNECFLYNINTKYREARDAVCSYIRYLYSNNWQKPESSTQMLSSKYFPDYFYKMSRFLGDVLEGPTVMVVDQDEQLLISRQNLRGLGAQDMFFVISPHLSCSREEDKSMVSVWYIDQNDNFTCLSYDYHDDTKAIDLEQYEDTDYDVLSPELKDFYEILFNKVYKTSLDYLGSQFVVPYHSHEKGMFLYNNTEFLKHSFAE